MLEEPLPATVEHPFPRPSRPRHFSPWLIVSGIGCLGVLLLCAFIGIVYLVRPAVPRATEHGLQTQKMPDGTLLTLEKVTFGTNHDFEYQQKQRPGPAWFSATPVHKRHIREHTAHPMLKCWLTRRDLNGNSLDFDWWSHNVAVDDLGHTFEDEDPGRTSLSNHGQSGYGGSRPFPAVGPGVHELIVVHSSIRPFRHAGNSFQLRVYDTHGTQVALFDVPDPVTGTFPVWNPEPIPSTKSAGDLAVTLTSLGAKRYEQELTGRKRTALQLAPKFEVRRGGQPAPEWQSRQIRFSDALGNTSDAWDCKLSPREGAWKMHVRLARGEKGTFATDEQASFGPFALPAKDATELIGKKQTLQGVTLELLAIGGAGQITYTDKAKTTSNGSWHNSFGMDGNIQGKFVTKTEKGVFTASVDSPVPHALFRITGSSAEIDLRLTAADDQERAVTVQPAQNGEMQMWALKMAEDAKSVTFSVTVQKMRSVEFQVAPPPDKIHSPQD